MQGFSEALDIISAVLFVSLGVAALWQWRQHRTSSTAWLAATFGVLAAVVIAGRLLPEHSDATSVAVARKILIAVIAFFPYFLFRFMASFSPPTKRMEAIAAVLTLAVIGGGLLVTLPEQGDPRTTEAQVFIYVLLVQWATLSIVVGVRLWKGGRGQPTVARRRMRTLSLGAIGLAIALILAGSAPAGEEVTPVQIIVQLLGILSAPLFLLGFAPPGLVKVLWRRPEERALREAHIGLMAATSPSDVADVLLPHVSHLLGGLGATLVDGAGEPVGSFGLEQDDVQKLWDHLDGDDQPDTMSVPFTHGALAVRASPYTPFFGREETDILADLAVLSDLTLARVQLFVELARSNSELEQFAYVTSHDLQEPLRTIAGFAQMIENRLAADLGEDTKRHLTYMVEGCDRMQQLINGLLNFSRVGTQAQPPEPFDSGEALDAALASLTAAIDESEVQIARTELPRVLADRSQLTQLFQNLIGNSIKFRGDEPLVINVSATRNGGGWRFTVSDNGIGIDPKYADRIFTIFKRLHTRDEYPGTGIGLAVCKKIVERHGGRLWLDEDAGSGATFHFEMPGERKRKR